MTEGAAAADPVAEPDEAAWALAAVIAAEVGQAGNAARNGGNALTSDDVAARLRDLGLDHVAQRPTVPGGPVMVIGQRPPG